MFGLCNDEKIAFQDISKVEVETYKIATEHAHVPWDDFASAQLSFPYLMGLDFEPLPDWPGPGTAVEPYVTDVGFRNLWSTWLRYLSQEPS